MTFLLDYLDDGVIVHVDEPRLDAAIAIRFKDRLREVTSRNGPRIVLDLSRVQFMDSSGLGAILAIRRGLGETRVLELSALTPNVDRVFRLTRMDSIFTIHDAPPRQPPDVRPDRAARLPGAAP